MYFTFIESTWRKFRNLEHGPLLFKTMKRKFINGQFKTVFLQKSLVPVTVDESCLNICMNLSVLFV